MSTFKPFEHKRLLTSTPAIPTSSLVRPSRPFAPHPTSQQVLPLTQEQPGHADRSRHSFERVSVFPLKQHATTRSYIPALHPLVTQAVQRRDGDDTRDKSVPLKENHTGLPDPLKAGVETLSGMSMDDVSVHYNSARPARLQSLAYTQGTAIHVTPGQEKQLAHEAWHVVQQKQGRVKPTLQVKGVAVNDDQGLEREADVMGTNAQTAGIVQGKNLAIPSPLEAGHMGKRAPLQLKLNDLGSWDRNRFGNIQNAEEYKSAVQSFYEHVQGTDTGKKPIEEINEALWVVVANIDHAHNVETWRSQLWKAKIRFEKGWHAPFNLDQVMEQWGEIIKYTNLILDNGVAEEHKQWKIPAVTSSSVTIQVVGGAVAALVSVPPAQEDERPTPKKLQLSLDRHYWGRLDVNSETKAQNTMIRHDVGINVVYDDMRVVATEYKNRMVEGQTATFNMETQDGNRKYLVEKLTTEEPHIFPVSGPAQTIDVPQGMHVILKNYHGRPPGNNEQWTTLVEMITDEGVKPATLYEKMAELKIPQKDINDLKKEAEDRGVGEEEEAPKKKSAAKKKSAPPSNKTRKGK